MSIVRIGLGETKNFAEGYDAIFGKKEKKPEVKPEENDRQANRRIKPKK